MCDRFLCCVISFFFFGTWKVQTPLHMKITCQHQAMRRNKRNRVKHGKGQRRGAKAKYCTCITPQQRREQFPHEPLTAKLTDSGEERLWCLCCGKPVAHEMKSSVKWHIFSRHHRPTTHKSYKFLVHQEGPLGAEIGTLGLIATTKLLQSFPNAGIGGPPDLTGLGFGVPIGSADLSARWTFGWPKVRFIPPPLPLLSD